MSFVEPQAPDSLPFSSSSLLFSSSSSCKDPPGLLRCLQDEWGKVIKNVWKSRTLDKLLWLVRGFVCQNSCFFMFLCTKKFEAFASGIKFLYPRGQRLVKKINRVVRGPSEKEPQTNWCYFTEQIISYLRSSRLRCPAPCSRKPFAKGLLSIFSLVICQKKNKIQSVGWKSLRRGII